MKIPALIAFASVFLCGPARTAEGETLSSGERKLNNLVSELLEVTSLSESSRPLTFTRSGDGWILVSATCNGKGTARVLLNEEPDPVIVHDGDGSGETPRLWRGALPHGLGGPRAPEGQR